MILIIRALLKLRYGFTQNHPLIYKTLAKYTHWEAAKECDILFFPGGAQIMKNSPITTDYIYYTDACFGQMIDYYWHNVRDKYVKLANVIEQYALNHSSLNIFSSNWAKDYACGFYNEKPDKNFILEFGANLCSKDICESAIYTGGQLNVLFSGVNWKRKGGDIAVETVKLLREKYGVYAVLNIAGIESLPNGISDLEYINNLGFLNKNIHEQYKRYLSAISNSHILLLPTKAECAGIVFCEASAHGLPIFTHNTGGIGNYVIDGINGYKLKIGSTPDDFVSAIYKSIKNNELTSLHNGGLKLYSEKLNWESWSERFKILIRNNYNKNK